MTEECKECFEWFKNKKQYDMHWNRFHRPPTWNPDGTIQLNASDQIRLILKDMAGSWEKYLSGFAKKKRMTLDYTDSVKLRQFELDNNLEFIVCGSEVKEYRKYESLGVALT